MIASLRGQAGIINNLGGGEVSVTEAYKLGSTLVRGFEAGGFGARLDQTQAGVSGELIGETAYAGLSAEIKFPIPMIPESYGLSGAVWADSAWVGGAPNPGVGTVDPDSTDNPFKASVGGSVIWDSPFGPLRGDLGYVLSKALVSAGHGKIRGRGAVAPRPFLWLLGACGDTGLPSPPSATDKGLNVAGRPRNGQQLQYPPWSTPAFTPSPRRNC